MSRRQDISSWPVCSFGVRLFDFLRCAFTLLHRNAVGQTLDGRRRVVGRELFCAEPLLAQQVKAKIREYKNGFPTLWT